jgi:hypothetical protein
LAKASHGRRSDRHLLLMVLIARSWGVRAPIPIQAPPCIYAARKYREALFPENGFRATAMCHSAGLNRSCVLTRWPTELRVGAPTAEIFMVSLKWAETAMAARSTRAASTTSTLQGEITAISPASWFPMEPATYRSAELTLLSHHPLTCSTQPAVGGLPGTRAIRLPTPIHLPRHSRFLHANSVIPALCSTGAEVGLWGRTAPPSTAKAQSPSSSIPSLHNLRLTRLLLPRPLRIIRGRAR